MTTKFKKKFYKNKIAVFGAATIILLVFISLLGYIIAPDNSENANNQNISLRLKKPGFKATFLTLNPSQIEDNSFKSLFFGKTVLAKQIAIDSFYTEGNAVHYKAYHQPYWKKLHIKSHPQNSIVKSRTYYLGTDGLGRDVLSRLIIGARISMIVGFIAVLISLFIGSIAGMLSGYYGGKIDRVILWLINVFWAIPTILLAMALMMSFKADSKYQIIMVFMAVGFTMWVDTARIVRGLIVQLKERQFVEAARALSFSDYRIVFKHIFPNTFSTLLVVTSSNFATAILMESGLSYLGLGVQPPTPSWGSMLREYYIYLGTDVSYLAIFPGLCIMLAVFSFYVLGNGLRDALDVKG